MRACEQCGLSMGDTATFCAVCGARAASRADSAPAAPVSRADVDEPMLSRPSVDEARGDSRAHEGAASRRPHEASPPAHEAGQCEKTDPARAAALYREAIVCLLETEADPLDREDVRRDLLFIFDRLSLVLKRGGLNADALEEIDCAASLGLLDCQDTGIKGHREALRKRRDSLRRSSASRALDAVT